MLELIRQFLDWLAELAARRERKRVCRERHKRGMAVIEQDVEQRLTEIEQASVQQDFVSTVVANTRDLDRDIAAELNKRFWDLYERI